MDLPVTDSKVVLDGEAHQRFLESVGRIAHLLEPLSEEEFVQRVLDFANWSGDDMWEAYDLEAALTTGAKNARRDRESTPPAPDVLKEGWAWTERQRLTGIRDSLRKDLGRIAADVKRERQHAEDYIMLPEGLATIPHPVLVNGKLETKALYMPANLLAAFDYAELLLIDSERELGDRLCKCKNEPNCEDFFLQPETKGRQRRKYCSDDCLDEAHRAGAAERMREMRKNRAEAKGKRSPRKSK